MDTAVFRDLSSVLPPLSRPTTETRALDLRLSRPGDTITVVHARGDIDLSTTPQLRDVLGLALRGAGVRTLVCDLSDVGFLAVCGLSTLLDIRARAAELLITLKVVAGHREVRRPIRLAEAEEQLGVCANIAEALTDDAAR